MGSGNGNSGPEAHQLGQHLGAGNDGNSPVAGFHQFRVLVRDGRGLDEHVRVAHVVRAVADEDRGPEVFQPSDRGRGGQVRAGDVESHVDEHLGDAVHAGTADAHHVDVVHPRPHGRAGFAADCEVGSLCC